MGQVQRVTVGLLVVAVMLGCLAGTSAAAQSVIVTAPPVLGVAFEDLDRDGEWGVAHGAREPGLAGVQVSLWADEDLSANPSEADVLIDMTWTASDGTFRFQDVAPGRYIVTSTPPAGYVMTTEPWYVVEVVEDGVGGTEVSIYFGVAQPFRTFIPLATR